VIDGIEPASLPGPLRRIRPFERWVVQQTIGFVWGLPEAAPGRTAVDIGADCGLPARRVTEIAEQAVRKMKAMQTLAAD